MMAPVAPIIQYCTVARLGKYHGIKLLASVHAIKKKTMIRVKCNRTGIPLTLLSEMTYRVSLNASYDL
jgi:hypothetical protein